MNAIAPLAVLDALESTLQALDNVSPYGPAAALLLALVLAWAALRFTFPGFWGLVLKQMRQRTLGTWLTLLSVTLGTALAIGIFVLERGSRSLFVQREFGYQLIIGSSKGSPLQLVMNTVYNLDTSPGTFQYEVYERLASEQPVNPTEAEIRAMQPMDRAEALARREQNRKRFPYWRYVKLAVPFARGDTYKSRPILATSPEMFGYRFVETSPATQPTTVPTTAATPATAPAAGGDLLAGDAKAKDTEKLPDPPRPGRLVQIPVYDSPQDEANGKVSNAIFQYRPDQRLELAEGTVFHPHKFQAVIGAEVAQKVGLKIGSSFQATHGDSKDEAHDHEAGGEHHHDEEWTVVGRLKPTGTSFDRMIFIPLSSFYCIPDHDEHIKAQANAQAGIGRKTGSVGGAKEEKPFKVDSDGIITLLTPKSKWQLSGVFVQVRGRAAQLTAEMYEQIRNGGMGAEVLAADVIAAQPGPEMRKFFEVFLKPSSQILLLISVLVSVLAVIGILVSIYNSVAARTREIAILRALGATKSKVLLLICLEAALIGLAGAFVGWCAGHLIGAAASQEMLHRFGQGFDWAAVATVELVFIAAVVVVSLLAGLVPAMKAYRTPVATNLTAS